jgi:hypothetical protein
MSSNVQETKRTNTIYGRLGFSAADVVTVLAGDGFTAAKDATGIFTVTVDSRLVPVKYICAMATLEGVVQTTDAHYIRAKEYALSNDVLTVTFHAIRSAITGAGTPFTETEEVAALDTDMDVSFMIVYEYEVGGETV